MTAHNDDITKPDIIEYFKGLENDEHAAIVKSMCRFNYSMGKTVGTMITTILCILLLPAAVLFMISPIVGAGFIAVIISVTVFGTKYFEHAILKIFIPMLVSTEVKQMHAEMLKFIELFKAVD